MEYKVSLPLLYVASGAEEFLITTKAANWQIGFSFTSEPMTIIISEEANL